MRVLREQLSNKSICFHIQSQEIQSVVAELKYSVARLSDRFFLSVASHTVKFDDCMGNQEVAFESSDPVFSVRADGSVFAKAGGGSLDQPARFKVTARGPRTHVWQTVVQVALTEPPSPQVSQTRPRQHTSHTLVWFMWRSELPSILTDFILFILFFFWWFAVLITPVRNQVKAPQGF